MDGEPAVRLAILNWRASCSPPCSLYEQRSLNAFFCLQAAVFDVKLIARCEHHMADIPTCKPPDPDTRAPRFRPPPGSCDAHCHIFGPGDRYPYAADRTYTPPDAPLSRFKQLQSILGLERAVLVNASCHGSDNTVIVDAIAQSGGRYRGVANADD